MKNTMDAMKEAGLMGKTKVMIGGPQQQKSLHERLGPFSEVKTPTKQLNGQGTSSPKEDLVRREGEAVRRSQV